VRDHRQRACRVQLDHALALCDREEDALAGAAEGEHAVGAACLE
jgi:hypothetical protein